MGPRKFQGNLGWWNIIIWPELWELGEIWQIIQPDFDCEWGNLSMTWVALKFLVWVCPYHLGSCQPFTSTFPIDLGPALLKVVGWEVLKSRWCESMWQAVYFCTSLSCTTWGIGLVEMKTYLELEEPFLPNTPCTMHYGSSLFEPPSSNNLADFASFLTSFPKVVGHNSLLRTGDCTSCTHTKCLHLTVVRQPQL